MADIIPPSGASSVQQQADAWVLWLQSGRATTRDAQSLRQWCAADAAHAQAFERARSAWHELGETGRLFRAAHPRDAVAPAGRRSPARRAFLGGALTAAGAAAATALVYPPLGLWPSLSELGADYRTAVGEQRRIDLRGGIQVVLNTQSSLSVDATGERREIALRSGELALSSDGTERAIDIVGRNGRVRMERGEVEVRLLPASVCVTCVSGGAQLRHPSGTFALAAGEQLTYDAHAVAPRTTAHAASAWRSGALVFRDTLLAEAVAEINRYRPGRVVLLNAQLGERRVSGKFRIAHLDQAIDRIEEAFGAHVRRLPGGMVLLS
ncbi:iron dicitrate transport regulator FecR [Variovorax sp. KBW07]|uniref:FecR family protein n=1 Tax=Variovorax sp. KBW07 TaxID=2153358 RepID=UPI000F568EA5|nr:FecR domain-containing protein [Variovorax sp. KBW07]RQO43088.1 iron dicitrate transport regulator FecR [Variovorax sp. KBW07]